MKQNFDRKSTETGNTFFQFDIAMERYQLNLQRSFQSLVPMERVAWNLANSGVEVDFSLFGSLRFYLQRSLYKVITTLKRLKQKKISVIQQVKIFEDF